MINMSHIIKPSTDEDHANPISPQDYLHKLFIKYDADNNGRISRFEFVSILRTLARVAGTSFPNETDLEDIFNYLDVDGDKTINFKQFQVLMDGFTKIMKQQGYKLKIRED